MLNLLLLLPNFQLIFEPFAPKEEFDLLSIHINQHNYELTLLKSKATVSPPSPSISIAFLNKMLDPPYNLRWTTIKVGT
jgi:hypothetical protein